MRRIAAAAAVMALAGAAHAQTVVDGSDAGVPKEIFQTAAGLVTKDTFDPGTVQFRNLRTKELGKWGTALCGEMNAKNRFGGYVGFLPFVYAPNADKSPVINAGDFSDQALRSSTAQIVRSLCSEQPAARGGS